MQSTEHDSLKHSITIGGIYIEKRIQRLANASKNIDELIDDSNCRAAKAQKAVQSTFRNKFVALAEHLQTFFSKRLQPYLVL